MQMCSSKSIIFQHFFLFLIQIGFGIFFQLGLEFYFNQDSRKTSSNSFLIQVGFGVVIQLGLEFYSNEDYAL